jgi:hypothetical protein
MKINRRDILKLGASSLLAACIAPFVSAQPSNPSLGTAGALSAPKMEGTISYNAGWVVPLEDKAPLLELEAKKTKEREDLIKQNSGASSDPSGVVKEKRKTFSDKTQDLFGKIKSLF